MNPVNTLPLSPEQELDRIKTRLALLERIIQAHEEQEEILRHKLEQAEGAYELISTALTNAHAALQEIIDQCPNPKLPYGQAVVEIASKILKPK